MSSPDPQTRLPGRSRRMSTARSHAVEDGLRRTIDAEFIPRLAFSRGTSTFAGPVPTRASSPVADVELFVRALRGPSESGVQGHVAELLQDGVTPEALYLDVMTPAARRLGEMWKQDTCSFLEVTLGMGRMQRAMRNLEERFRSGATTPGNGRHILLTALPGEQHTFGLLLLAEFFLRDGWAVEMGAPFGESDPVSRLSGSWYDVAGFSVACVDHLGGLQREIGRARRLSRNRDLRVLVGGAPFVERPDLVRRVGADGTADDAGLAVRVALEGLL